MLYCKFVTLIHCKLLTFTHLKLIIKILNHKHVKDTYFMGQKPRNCGQMQRNCRARIKTPSQNSIHASFLKGA